VVVIAVKTLETNSGWQRRRRRRTLKRAAAGCNYIKERSIELKTPLGYPTHVVYYYLTYRVTAFKF
jgi:hypothetical protein